MIPIPAELWPPLIGILGLLAALLASGHAVLYKRDVRAAAGWVGVIWLVPVVGSILYFLLGVNRIRRRASALSRERPRPALPESVAPIPVTAIERSLGEADHLGAVARITDVVLRRAVEPGNSVRPLIDGDEAYPEMLAAIERAGGSVSLSTYIFDNDVAGRRFVEALAAAVRRGVEVRVLIDAVGVRYTFPPVDRLLRRENVRSARFLPSFLPAWLPYLNLRNHRKLLVVDGRIGFTGGMNIREGCLLRENPAHPVRDLHFRVDGPVVRHLQEVFAEDWAFTTGEVLNGPRWFPDLEPRGGVLARGIVDGPDEDFETLRWTLLAAITAARRSVLLLTPYFLPDAALITALNLAAMRGVRVDIVLPQKGNLALVQWASTAQLWQVLERGCRVHLTPPPFDHSKLLIVDGAWSLIGSANWDPRSLRLNFEFDLECYDEALAAELERIAAEKIASARTITLADVDGRPLPVRLRDGVARLLSPYL